MLMIYVGDVEINDDRVVVAMDSNAFVGCDKEYIIHPPQKCDAKQLAGFIKQAITFKTRIGITLPNDRMLSGRGIIDLVKAGKIRVVRGKPINTGRLDLFKHIIPLLFSNGYSAKQKIEFFMDRSNDVQPYMILQIMARNWEKLIPENKKALASLNRMFGKLRSHKLFIETLCRLITPQNFKYPRWNLGKVKKD